jgi:flagellar basal body P-ring formation protein FlgA
MDSSHPAPLAHRLPLAFAFVLMLMVSSLHAFTPAQTQPDANPPALLRLLHQATVDSSGIHLHQLITNSNPAALPIVHLAPAPISGQFLLLSRHQVNELIRRHAPYLATTNWSGATQIHVSRRSRPLDETELKELLTQAIAQERASDRGELELRFPRPWITLPVPDEPLTVRILDIPTTGVSPFFIARFELLAGSERIGHWQLPLQARLWHDVLVAQSPLRRGQLLADADLRTERRDILSLRDALPADARSDSSLELLVNVNSDQPILNRSVRQRFLILRGQQIPALILNGPLTISLKVEALENGHAGQTVRVRNPRTRRELTGIVQHEQSILIRL